DDAGPRLLGATEFDLAGWRSDGQVVGLGRLGADGRLALELQASADGAPQRLEVPLAPARGYAAEWDLARARVLVAGRSADGGVGDWLGLVGLGGRAGACRLWAGWRGLV